MGLNLAGHSRRSPAAAMLMGGLSLACSAWGLAAASLVATLDSNTTQPGEPVQYALTFTGGRPDQAPAAPSVAGLTFSYVGPSSQLQIINGQTSSSYAFLYLVTAAKPGEYTIPSVRAEVGGQTLSSQPLKLVVGQADSRFAHIAFLRLLAPKREVFLGEAMLLEIHLFAQAGRLVQPPQIKGDGVTIGKLAQVSATQVLTNGIPYQVVSYRAPVTFVKTGDFALSAGDCLLDVQFRKPGSTRSRFGLDLDDFFGGGVETRRLTLSSEPVTIRAQELPAGAVPPGFTGAVGHYRLTAALSTNAVAAGDPITLTVQIEGQGPFDSLQWAAPATWAGFRTYAPSTSVKASDDFGLAGVKTFEQAIIPESPQVREIPPITFSFFDPELRQYRTLTHPAMPITVRKAAAVDVQPVVVATSAAARPEEKAAVDIVHIKSRPGLLAQVRPPLIERPAFLALQGLPVLAWIAALAWRRRADRFARDPRLRRRQQAVRRVREGLAELRGLAAQHRSEDFYAAVFRLLQEQIGERLDLPASAITEAVVEDRLQPLGLDPSLLAEVRELFQLCNQARYAPSPQAGELASLLARVESALRRLRSI